MSGVHSRGTPGSNCDQPMREPPGLAACSCRPAPSPPARRLALTLEGRLNKMTASISMPPRLLTAGPLSKPARSTVPLHCHPGRVGAPHRITLGR